MHDGFAAHAPDFPQPRIQLCKARAGNQLARVLRATYTSPVGKFSEQSDPGWMARATRMAAGGLSRRLWSSSATASRAEYLLDVFNYLVVIHQIAAPDRRATLFHGGNEAGFILKQPFDGFLHEKCSSIELTQAWLATARPPNWLHFLESLSGPDLQPRHRRRPSRVRFVRRRSRLPN
jgi:hypothetical protein